jgi:hypothetical protein
MPPSDDKPDVLSSLPRTRPQRRSARRDSAATPKPKAAAKPKPKPRAAAKPKATASAAPRKRAAAPRPKAVPTRIPPAGFAPPRDTEERGAPSGVELVGTAVQAAGELVQIGAAIGSQALKSALGRLGRS